VLIETCGLTYAQILSGVSGLLRFQLILTVEHCYFSQKSQIQGRSDRSPEILVIAAIHSQVGLTGSAIQACLSGLPDSEWPA
jgi:hypothetical protein